MYFVQTCSDINVVSYFDAHQFTSCCSNLYPNEVPDVGVDVHGVLVKLDATESKSILYTVYPFHTLSLSIFGHIFWEVFTTNIN